MDNETSFNNFISRFLSQHHSPYIKKASFSFPKYSERDFANLFLRRAQFCCAQQLHITACFATDWMSQFSSCKLLTSLEISTRYVNDLECLMLPSLRILVMERLLDATFWDDDDYLFDECEDYDDDDNDDWDVPLRDNTFSGCPNLESLVLVDCVFKMGCVFAPKLEHLDLINNGSFESLVVFPKVWLCTPNLRSVKFKNVVPCVMSTSSEFMCIDKVYMAVDDYDFERKAPWGEIEENISQLLRVFRNATSLTLPPNAIQVLFKVPSLLSGCCFNNLRHMKFREEGTNKMIDLPIQPNAISNFIECPNLETFSVDSTASPFIYLHSLEKLYITSSELRI